MAKQHYPKWIVNKHGASVIAQSPEDHSRQVGYEVNEDGTRKAASPDLSQPETGDADADPFGLLADKQE